MIDELVNDDVDELTNSESLISVCEIYVMKAAIQYVHHKALECILSKLETQKIKEILIAVEAQEHEMMENRRVQALELVN